MKVKKWYLYVLIVIIMGLGITILNSRGMKVHQTDNVITVKVHGSKNKEVLGELFDKNVYIVWSEFNELPSENYDEFIEYEGTSYGCSYYSNGDNNLLTIANYYNGVYMSMSYLRYMLEGNNLKVEFVDSENTFNGVEIQNILVGYLKSKGLK